MAEKKSKKTVDFESSLADLETIVDQMESGELSLEESLKAFENGIKLTQVCQDALQKAEQKVQMLVEKSSGLSLEDYEDHLEEED